MTSEEKVSAIRLMATAIVIAEYGLLKFVDGSHQELKLRVKNAITSCRRVQDYFLKHGDASPETRAKFKEQFLSDEIVLLSELLETCFGINAEGLEDIIKAIKASSEPQLNP